MLFIFISHKVFIGWMSTVKYLPSKIGFGQQCVFFVRPWSRSDILFLSVSTKPMMAYKNVLPRNIINIIWCRLAFFFGGRRRNMDGGTKNIYYSILIPKTENMFLLCVATPRPELDLSYFQRGMIQFKLKIRFIILFDICQ